MDTDSVESFFVVENEQLVVSVENTDHTWSQVERLSSYHKYHNSKPKAILL